MVTEGRAPTAPEMMRDFELLLSDRLAEERRRRRKADAVARMSFVVAVLALAATAVLAYSLFTGAGPAISAGSITAQEVSLIDGNGRTRGRWYVQDGAARLTLMDERGVERMRMTLLDNGSPGISLADSRGEGRVVMSLESGEGSRLTFADGAGRPRTMLGLTSAGGGSLLFADEAGQPRAAMGLEADGRGMFVLPGAEQGPTGDGAGS